VNTDELGVDAYDIVIAPNSYTTSMRSRIADWPSESRALKPGGTICQVAACRIASHAGPPTVRAMPAVNTGLLPSW
jgi:hypothetical protein